MLRKLGRLISCKDASRAISQMQDGDVPLPLYLRIRLHLVWCEACRRFLDQMRFLHGAMRQYRQ
jgi:predicted anti-sigma-YlaC factor YlaD